MAELADAGEITVGVKYDQPGLGFKGAADDIPSGFDIEIAKLLVADLGIDPESDKVTWEETISDNREPFLEQGRVDLVLASYSITDERREIVGQTGPYLITGQQVLVPADSDVESIDDLKGKEVCSVTGSTSIDNINAEGAKGVGYDSYSECVEKVLDGTVGGDVDRRLDPRRVRRPERGRAQGRRRAVLRGADRRRLLEGHPGDVRVDQRRPRGVLRGRLVGRCVRADARRPPVSRRPSRRSSTSAQPA